MNIHSTTNSERRHFEVHPEVHRIGEAIVENGGTPYLVGGWVRDRLLGLTGQPDYDLEVFQLPMQLLKKILLPFGPVHSVGRHFGVLKLATDNAAYDVSVPRRESNIGKGHKGFKVTPDPTMSFEEAAARRDFTINAMGYDFRKEILLDLHGGERDLKQGVLRHVGPAFAEDPLRVLRAMRFAGRFGFRIAPDTLALCRQLNLAELPRERIWEEFKKLLLQSPRPSQGFGYAQDLGVLNFFPELQALHDAKAVEGSASPWELTMAFVDQAALARKHDPGREAILMTAALCFGLTLLEEARPEEMTPEGGKLETGRQAPGEPGLVKGFLERLTNETRFLENVTGLTAELVGWRAMFKNRDRAQDGEVRRLALRIQIPFLLLAASALHRAEHGEAAFSTGAWMESRARALGVWEGPPEPLLKGRHLVKHGLKTGREMGEMLELVFQLQLDGAITNREDALAWVSERASTAQWKEGVPHGGAPSSGAPSSGAPSSGAPSSGAPSSGVPAKDFEKPLGGGKNKGRGGKP